MRPKLPEEKKLLFFSFVGENYSRSSTILNFNSARFQKKYISLTPGAMRSLGDLLKRIREIRSADFLVVMSPCHVITPVLKMISKNHVILDAGWSLTDGQLSRGKSFRKFPKLIRIYMLDFAAFHSADLVIAESQCQALRMKKLFRISMGKIRVNFTGLDENLFGENPSVSETLNKLDEDLKALNLDMTVLFRGKINNESGIENIIDCARVLRNEVAFIIVCGQNDLIKGLPSNVIRLSNLSNFEMSEVYKKSDACLGQISSHPRLGYTIPHKAFEAGFFSKPYITANSSGIQELYDFESAILLDDISGEAVALEILKLKDLRVRRSKSVLISKSYNEKASQEVLNNVFEKWLLELN
jgi:glycosyltransferase involved in cell wall biosynthesis